MEYIGHSEQHPCCDWCHWCHWCHEGPQEEDIPLAMDTTLAGICQQIQKKKRIWHPAWLRGSPRTRDVSRSDSHHGAEQPKYFSIWAPDLSHLQIGQVLFMLYKYTPILCIGIYGKKVLLDFNTLRWKLEGLSLHVAVFNKTQKLTRWGSNLHVPFQLLSIL